MANGLETVLFKYRTAGSTSLLKELCRRNYAVIHYTNYPPSANPEEYQHLSELNDSDQADERSTLNSKVDYMNNWVENGAIVGTVFPNEVAGVKIGGIGLEDSPSTQKIWILVCTENKIRAEVPLNPREGTKDFEKKLLDPPEEATIDEGAQNIWEQVKYQVRENESKLWSQQKPHIEIRETNKTHTSDPIIFKACKMESSNWAWYRNHPVLHAYRKQGTCQRWIQDSAYLKATFHGQTDIAKQKLGISFRDVNKEQYHSLANILSYTQLELICAEYLREFKHQGYAPVLDVGRSLEGIDISAIDTELRNLRILAQVTQETDFDDLNSKIDSLHEFGQTTSEEKSTDVQLYFFSRYEKDELEENHKIDSVDSEIEFITTKTVLKRMEQNRPDFVSELFSLTNPSETPDPEFEK